LEKLRASRKKKKKNESGIILLRLTICTLYVPYTYTIVRYVKKTKGFKRCKLKGIAVCEKDRRHNQILFTGK
jgi:hypothetical protein